VPYIRSLHTIGSSSQNYHTPGRERCIMHWFTSASLSMSCLGPRHPQRTHSRYRHYPDNNGPRNSGRSTRGTHPDRSRRPYIRCSRDRYPRMPPESRVGKRPNATAIAFQHGQSLVGIVATQLFSIGNEPSAVALPTKFTKCLVLLLPLLDVVPLVPSSSNSTRVSSSCRRWGNSQFDSRSDGIPHKNESGVS
jgi:hypothetical protein